MNRYMKLFLVLGISFGGSMGILLAFRHGLYFGIIIGIIAGVCFGGIMASILGLIHSRSVQRISHESTNQDMDVEHIKSIELKIPYNVAFEFCLEALDSIKKYKIKKKNKSRGSIYVKTGMTWKTWGDNILFKLFKINEKSTRVEISSKPTVRTTLIDYGKNLDNIENIISYLKSKCCNS